MLTKILKSGQEKEKVLSIHFQRLPSEFKDLQIRYPLKIHRVELISSSFKTSRINFSVNVL
jgi:hypothetical protein